MIRYVPAYLVPLLASVAGIAVFTRLLPPQVLRWFVIALSATVTIGFFHRIL